MPKSILAIELEACEVAATVDDAILVRLTKIRREFEKLSGKPILTPVEPKDLTLFGLTLDEAEDWTKNEPDFTPKHPLRRPRDKLTPYLREGGMPVTINTIVILNCDGNTHIWVSGVSTGVLTWLAGV